MKLTKKVLINRQLLVEELNIKYKLSVGEVCELLGVSEATARRLFARLEQEGSAVRTHGGIALVSAAEFDYSFERFDGEHIEQKNAIAECAAKRVRDNCVIYIDSGTTAARFSRALAGRLRNGDVGGITVFTNSLEALNRLSDACEVYLVGGRYRPRRKDFHGYIAENSVRKLRFCECFLGADGFSDFSFMTGDYASAALNEIVIENSESVNIITDSTKFYRSAFVAFCRLSDGRINVITDDGLRDSELMGEIDKRAKLIIVSGK